MRWTGRLGLSRNWWVIAAAGFAAAATYALNGLVAEVNGSVLSVLSGVAAGHNAPVATDDTLTLTTHEPSVCCEPFLQGLRLLAWPAFVGGVPMAITALLMLRMRGRTRTMPGRALARAGFVLQLFSVCLWTMAFVILVRGESDNSVEFDSRGWLVIGAGCAIWLAHTVIGVLGTAAWWRLADGDPGYTSLFPRQSTQDTS